MYYFFTDEKIAAEADILDKTILKLKSMQIEGDHFVVNSSSDLVLDKDQFTSSGSNTLVAIGDDNLLHSLINAAVKLPLEFVLGYIPVVKETTLLDLFGIKDWKSACRILANRKIHNFNLLSLNNTFYLDKITISATDSINQPIRIEVNDQFVLNCQCQEITITNLANRPATLAKDCLLEIFAQSKSSSKAVKFWQSKAIFSGVSSEKIVNLKADQFMIEQAQDGFVIKNYQGKMPKSIKISKYTKAIKMIIARHHELNSY